MIPHYIYLSSKQFFNLPAVVAGGKRVRDSFEAVASPPPPREKLCAVVAIMQTQIMLKISNISYKYNTPD